VPPTRLRFARQAMKNRTAPHVHQRQFLEIQSQDRIGALDLGLDLRQALGLDPTDQPISVPPWMETRSMRSVIANAIRADLHRCPVPIRHRLHHDLSPHAEREVPAGSSTGTRRGEARRSRPGTPHWLGRSSPRSAGLIVVPCFAAN